MAVYVLFGCKLLLTPAIRGEATIGFATAYGVPPLSEKVLFSQEMPPVWPHPEGDQRGFALMPLYENLPLAAKAFPTTLWVVGLV